MKLRTVFIYLSFLFFSIAAKTKPFNQQIYEEIAKVKCQEVSEKELWILQCQLSPQKKVIRDLDRLAETIIFTDLANCESSRLECLQKEIKYILSSTEIQDKLVTSTCGRLVQVRDSMSNIDFLEKWIKTYKSVNDASIRPIPPEDIKSNKMIIDNFERRRLLYQEQINTLRENDVLLSSPHIFQKISNLLQPSFWQNKKNDVEICAILKKEIPDLLKKDLEDHQQGTLLIKSNSNKNEGPEDDQLKRQLWNSSCRNDLIKKMGAQSDLSNSTFCRMEGRYGLGAIHGDKLKTIASFGLGFGVAGVGRLAGLAAAKRAANVYSIARTIAVTEILVGATLTGYQISQACKEKLNSVSGKKTCTALTDSEFKNLFYQQQETNECVIASTTGVIFSGLSALGAASVLRGKVTGKLESELEARALETQKIQQAKRDQFKERFKLTSTPDTENKSIARIQAGKNILTNNKIRFDETTQKSLIVVPDANNKHPFMQLVNDLKDQGFRMEVAYPGSRSIPEGAWAAVNHETRTMAIPLWALNKMDDPEVIGIIQHEKRHILESLRGSDASKLSLEVVQGTQNDTMNMGYGTRFFYRLDEPLAYYQGGAIEKALSNGKNLDQLYDGKILTERLNQIFEHIKDLKSNFRYDPKTGQGIIEINTPGGGESVLGTALRPGKYNLGVNVGPGLNQSQAAEESQKILNRYLEKLKRIENSTKRLIGD